MFNVQNLQGLTPLNLGCKTHLNQPTILPKSRQMICYLLSVDCKVMIPDYEDNYPFDYCADAELRVLLATKGLFECVDKHYFNEKVFNRLINAGADPCMKRSELMESIEKMASHPTTLTGNSVPTDSSTQSACDNLL